MTIELPVLGLLNDRSMHGYELHQALEKVVGQFRSVSWGSIYPMLKKLEQRGYLTTTTQPSEKGLERIVYEITPAGEKRLIELLTIDGTSTKPAGRNDFMVKVAFFHNLQPSQRLQIIENYKAKLKDKLDVLLHEQERVSKQTNRYRKLLIGYAVSRLENDLAWINSLIQLEKGD